MPGPTPLVISLDGDFNLKLRPQQKLLSERLKAMGYKVHCLEFPLVAEPSDNGLQNYLISENTQSSQANPYLGSIYATWERLKAHHDMATITPRPDIIILSHYFFSTLLYEGSKISNIHLRDQYFTWLYQLEFFAYGIMKPSISCLFRSRERSGKFPADQSEAIIEQRLCSLFPDDCALIEEDPMTKSSITSLHNVLWETLLRRSGLNGLRNIKSGMTRHDVAPKSFSDHRKATESSVHEIDIGAVSLLLAMRLRACGIKTTITDDLHWMELSSGDQRLSEKLFYPISAPNEKLLRQYRLVLGQIVGKMRDLDDHQRQYRSSAKAPSLEGNLSLRKRTQALLDSLLPLGHLVRVRLELTATQAKELLATLSSDPLAEAQNLARLKRSELKGIFVNSDDGTAAGVSYAFMVRSRNKRRRLIDETVKRHLPSRLTDLPDSAVLISWHPRNELSLVPVGLFGYTHLGMEDIGLAIDQQPYMQKISLLRELLSTATLRETTLHSALSLTLYQTEILTDFSTYRLASELLSPISAPFQPLTPRYGYDIPLFIERTGLIDDFQNCFDLSYELFSALQSAGAESEAQYATLAGHRLRWEMTFTAHDLLRLIVGAKNDLTLLSMNRFIDSVLERISEVHPIIAESLRNACDFTCSVDKSGLSS